MWVALFIILLSSKHISSQDIQVSTPLGKILGTTLTTRLDKTFYAFRGIRYAKPPIGALRFKAPVPIEQWSGIYNATTDGPACPQPTDERISEDCLVINVYTSKLPNNESNSKRPVIVYLHAGGFYRMTSSSKWSGPQYLLDKDIVVVTLNYRLGSLGFISVGKEAPGNNGLKDQVVAMRWVRDNIASFGGDPDSITLYGYSIGAWCIALHMVSPMSRGLFHKAIIASGPAMGYWPVPINQLDVAKKQARIVGCPDNTTEEILDCLRTKSAKELGDSLLQFGEDGFDPILIWSAVIEEDFGQERFLTDHPDNLIKNGLFEKIPVMAGATKDEFAKRAFAVANNFNLLQKLNNNFEKYAPNCFSFEKGTNKSKEISRRVRQFYFGDEPLTNSSLQRLVEAFTDSNMGFPINRAVNLISKYSDKPVYYYQFTYQSNYSYFYLPNYTEPTPYGVVHHDDQMYLFYISPLFPFCNASCSEGKMIEKLTSLWFTFAKTGNPTDHRFNKICDAVDWTPYNASTKTYMDIGKNFILKRNLHEKRYSFWRNLYPNFAY